MTDVKMALFELIEQRADHDFIREILAFAAGRLMGAQDNCRGPAVATGVTASCIEWGAEHDPQV